MIPVDARLLGYVEEIAALERVPMRMTVFTARLESVPAPAAELAAIGWTTGDDDYAPLLAPAVRDHVIPALRDLGSLLWPRQRGALSQGLGGWCSGDAWTTACTRQLVAPLVKARAYCPGVVPTADLKCRFRCDWS